MPWGFSVKQAQWTARLLKQPDKHKPTCWHHILCVSIYACDRFRSLQSITATASISIIKSGFASFPISTSACRRNLSVILGADISQCLYLGHVGYVGVDFHHVVERCTDRGESELQILEDLSCLRTEIAFADDTPRLVERDLARNIDRPAAADFGRHGNSRSALTEFEDLDNELLEAYEIPYKSI